MVDDESGFHDLCVRLVQGLQRLAQGRGAHRADLIEQMQGELSELRRLWRIDPAIKAGADAVQHAVKVQLNLLIRQLESPLKHKETKQYRTIIGVCFNVFDSSDFQGVNLHDRRRKLAERYDISMSTVQRYLTDAIDQMARVLASSDYRPEAIPIATGETDPTHLPLQSIPRVPSNLLAHLVALSGAVRQALETARESCQTRGRAFYTFDLLLAVLDMPDSRVMECFKALGADLAEKIRDKLLTMPDRGKPQHLFVPFEWAERSDVQLAWQYALQDGAPAITDLHLLLAVLDGQSETNGWLKRFLGEGYYPTLRATADRMRRDGPLEIKSPTPD